MKEIKEFVEFLESKLSIAKKYDNHMWFSILTQIKNSKQYETLKSVIDKPVSKSVMEITEEMVEIAVRTYARLTNEIISDNQMMRMRERH